MTRLQRRTCAGIVLVLALVLLERGARADPPAEDIAALSAMGRAEALRHAMLTMIDQGEPYETHPAYWGPFVVMGEGG